MCVCIYIYIYIEIYLYITIVRVEPAPHPAEQKQGPSYRWIPSACGSKRLGKSYHYQLYSFVLF